MAKQKAVTSIALFQEKTVRRVWHEERWFFSITDGIGVLTLSTGPRVYWAKMKERIHDEKFEEAVAKCIQIEMIATDRKMRETDCADIETIYHIVQAVPALRRRKYMTPTNAPCKCGIYSIMNTITEEQYIGSSIDIPNRFMQHQSELRRGKHHSPTLQVAWDQYSEGAFLFIIREEVLNSSDLEAIEQMYLDAEQPSYNVAPLATNAASLKPLTEAEIQAFMAFLRENAGIEPGPLALEELRFALDVGIVIPGPKYHVLAQAEMAGVTTFAGLQAFLSADVAASSGKENAHV